MLIFISYSRKNEHFVRLLARDLADKGLDTWIDFTSIQGGDTWRKAIVDGIKGADAVIVCLSKDAIESEWVRRELFLANSLEKRIVPITVEQCIDDLSDYDETKQLLEKQIIAFQTDYSKGLELLLLTLQGNAKVSHRQISSIHEDWGEAPSTNVFYGRDDEVAEMKDWILTDNCRLILLLAMGGMGKTALSVKIAKQVKDNFEFVIWRSLRNAPPFEDILRTYTQVLSNYEQVDLPEDENEQITLLFNHLRGKKGLLILDNVESVLQSGDHIGQCRTGYEAYGQFFRRFGESEHQSCLVLTSREKPRELSLIEGESTPVRTKQLGGLSTAAGERLLKDRKLYGSNDSWTTLVQHYSGNPLALKLVSSTIQDLFNGNINEFLSSGITLFGDIQDVIKEQFARLSPAEKEIMYWLCIEREWVSIDTLQSNVTRSVPKNEILSSLLFLQRRSIIERNEAATFSTQPVVMEYVTNRITDEAYSDIMSSTDEFISNYTLIQAQAKDYIRNSQIRLILQPLIEHLLDMHTRSDLETRLQSLLISLRGIPKKSGYFAGNVINLLVQMKADLTSYDLSGLNIGQAYLRDINLHNVNFAHSNFAKSVFTETFGSVLAVTFSPTGDRLAIGAASGEIRIWEVASNKQTLTLEGHEDWVRFLVFSPDGNVIYSCSEDQTVRSWDVLKGLPLQVMREHKNRVRTIALNSTGQYLVSASEDHTVIMWETETAKPIRIFSGHHGPVRSVAFSPDDRLIASCSDDSLIKIWDAQTGDCLRTLEGHVNQVWSVTFSSDGKFLASGGEDKSIKLWDTDSWNCADSLQGHLQPVRSVAFSPLSDLIATGSEDRIVRLWDVRNSQCVMTLQGHTSRIRVVVFSPNGRLLATGSEDQTVRLWDVKSGECLRSFQGYNSRVWSAAYSPNGELIAGGGDDSIVRIWQVNSGDIIRRVPQFNQIRWLAFNPGGSLLAIASEDQNVELINVNTGKSFGTLKGHTARARTAVFNPADKNQILTGGDDQVLRLWNINSGSCVRVYHGHTGWIRAVTFSSDGLLAASGAEDGSARLWNVETAECVFVFAFSRVWSVAFSPDKPLLAAGCDDRTTRLFDIRTGEVVEVLTHQNRGVWAVAFSPNNRWLATGGDDLVIRIWDTESWECVSILDGHMNRVRAMEFHPDSTVLASASDDQTVKVWDVTSGINIKTLRGDKPYQNMNISYVTGITDAERATLKALGAVEN